MPVLGLYNESIKVQPRATQLLGQKTNVAKAIKKKLRRRETLRSPCSLLSSRLQLLLVLERLGQRDGRRPLKHQRGWDGLHHRQVQRTRHQHPALAPVTTAAAVAAATAENGE